MSDCICRQAAIDACLSFLQGENTLVECPEECDAIVYGSVELIEQLPSAQQKKGKWIKMSDADGIYWACSECGEDIPRTESIDKINFCPVCGADMRQ